MLYLNTKFEKFLFEKKLYKEEDKQLIIDVSKEDGSLKESATDNVDILKERFEKHVIKMLLAARYKYNLYDDEVQRIMRKIIKEEKYLS
jgi:chorismate mutase